MASATPGVFWPSVCPVPRPHQNHRGPHLGQPCAGFRDDAATADLKGILTEEVATTVREAALYSMGTDITAADLQQIQECCTKLIDHAQEYHPTD